MMTSRDGHLDDEVAARLEFGLDAALAAQRLILSYYQQPDLAVERKADESPVTAADRGAEELLRTRISRTFSDDAILGEEFGEDAGGSGFRWILDPVDGTKSFICGVPLFGTLIGLERIGVESFGESVMGICRLPALDQVVYAMRGGGAWWQIGSGETRRAAVSKCERLDEGLFAYTSVDLFDHVGRRDLFEALLQETRSNRGWGDCYGHMLVATGRAEVMVDPLLNLWDAAALAPIVSEAGGVFFDWEGNETIHGGNGISVNGALADSVRQLLNV